MGVAWSSTSKLYSNIILEKFELSNFVQLLELKFFLVQKFSIENGMVQYSLILSHVLISPLKTKSWICFWPLLYFLSLLTQAQPSTGAQDQVFQQFAAQSYWMGPLLKTMQSLKLGFYHQCMDTVILRLLMRV